jgi:hypothetical protein
MRFVDKKKFFTVDLTHGIKKTSARGNAAAIRFHCLLRKGVANFATPFLLTMSLALNFGF